MRRGIGAALAALGLVVVTFVAWVGVRSYQANSALHDFADTAAEVRAEFSDLDALDLEALEAAAGRLRDAAAAASAATRDPAYALAAELPLLGANLAAVREITEGAGALAYTVVPAYVESARLLAATTQILKDGSIDIDLIESVAARLIEADQEVGRLQDELAAIDRTKLINLVGGALQDFQLALSSIRELSAPAARAARIVPTMLGQDGHRRYLVVFQNLAEPRATGGIFGSYAVVEATDGKLRISDQGASRKLGEFDPPILDLPAGARRLYGAHLATFPQDVNFTPEFPLAAKTFATMYAERTGQAIDGVLAVDPVTLSYLMKGMKGVAIGDGVVLTSKNVVPLMLSTIYESFDGVDQDLRDDYLAEATSLVFASLISGGGTLSGLRTGVSKGIEERRVLLWSSHPDEQEEIERTSLAGDLDRVEQRTAPTVGVYLNDGTGAKLGFYLKNSVTIAPSDCGPDGRRRLDLTVRLDYEAPSEGLSDYVLGLSKLTRPYVLQTNVMVFAPVGGGLAGVTDGHQELGYLAAVDNNREVAVVTAYLEPGQSATLEFSVVAPPTGDSGPVTPVLDLTPMVKKWATKVTGYEPC